MTSDQPAAGRGERFEIRPWLAQVSGCSLEDLRLTDNRVRSDYRGAQDATYVCGAQYAGRVMIGAATTLVETEPARRQVSAVWPGGSATIKVSAESEIVW